MEYLTKKDTQAFKHIQSKITPNGAEGDYSKKNLPFKDFKQYLSEFENCCGNVSDSEFLEYLAKNFPLRL